MGEGGQWSEYPGVWVGSRRPGVAATWVAKEVGDETAGKALGRISRTVAGHLGRLGGRNALPVLGAIGAGAGDGERGVVPVRLAAVDGTGGDVLQQQRRGRGRDVGGDGRQSVRGPV